MTRLAKELQTRNSRKTSRITLLRRSLIAAAIASTLVVGTVSPASAATVGVTGGTATYSYGFSGSSFTSTGWVKMTIKDARADGYCVHGSVTFNVSLAPDPTYDSPNICGYGTSGVWTISLKKPVTARVNGMLVKVCKTVANAPDPCGSEYVER